MTKRQRSTHRKSVKVGAVCLLFASVFTIACTVRYGAPLPDGTPADEVPWIDGARYPFASHFLAVPGGKLHFIDEGPRSAAPIVFVHGTPTWSFLYRHIIKNLDGEQRCIAFDHIGFGLSSKPTSEEFAYAPSDHTENLVRLLDELDLESVTLLVHDLGGPIGIGAALARPERIARIVVINSFSWSLAENEQVQTIDSLLQSSFGEWLYLKRNISPEYLLPGAFSDNHELSSEILRHYTHPFADETTRSGLLQIGRGLIGSSEWYADLWAEHESLESKIQLLVFGLDDEFFGRDAFETWKTRFPNARAVGLEGVGHFPQEEAPLELTRALRELLEDGNSGVVNGGVDDGENQRGAARRN